MRTKTIKISFEVRLVTAHTGSRKSWWSQLGIPILLLLARLLPLLF